MYLDTFLEENRTKFQWQRAHELHAFASNNALLKLRGFLTGSNANFQVDSNKKQDSWVIHPVVNWRCGYSILIHVDTVRVKHTELA